MFISWLVLSFVFQFHSCSFRFFMGLLVEFCTYFLIYVGRVLIKVGAVIWEVVLVDMVDSWIA